MFNHNVHIKCTNNTSHCRFCATEMAKCELMDLTRENTFERYNTILSYLKINLLENNNLPKLACLLCHNKCLEILNFFLLVQRSQLKLCFIYNVNKNDKGYVQNECVGESPIKSEIYTSRAENPEYNRSSEGTVQNEAVNETAMKTKQQDFGEVINIDNYNLEAVDIGVNNTQSANPENSQSYENIVQNKDVHEFSIQSIAPENSEDSNMNNSNPKTVELGANKTQSRNFNSVSENPDSNIPLAFVQNKDSEIVIKSESQDIGTDDYINNCTEENIDLDVNNTKHSKEIDTAPHCMNMDLENSHDIGFDEIKQGDSDGEDISNNNSNFETVLFEDISNKYQSSEYNNMNDIFKDALDITNFNKWDIISNDKGRTNIDNMDSENIETVNSIEPTKTIDMFSDITSDPLIKKEFDIKSELKVDNEDSDINNCNFEGLKNIYSDDTRDISQNMDKNQNTDDEVGSVEKQLNSYNQANLARDNDKNKSLTECRSKNNINHISISDKDLVGKVVNYINPRTNNESKPSRCETNIIGNDLNSSSFSQNFNLSSNDHTENQLSFTERSKSLVVRTYYNKTRLAKHIEYSEKEQRSLLPYEDGAEKIVGKKKNTVILNQHLQRKNLISGYLSNINSLNIRSEDGNEMHVDNIRNNIMDSKQVSKRKKDAVCDDKSNNINPTISFQDDIQTNISNKEKSVTRLKKNLKRKKGLICESNNTNTKKHVKIKKKAVINSKQNMKRKKYLTSVNKSNNTKPSIIKFLNDTEMHIGTKKKAVLVSKPNLKSNNDIICDNESKLNSPSVTEFPEAIAKTIKCNKNDTICTECIKETVPEKANNADRTIKDVPVPNTTEDITKVVRGLDNSKDITKDGEVSDDSGDVTKDVDVSENSGDVTKDVDVSENIGDVIKDVDVSDNSGYRITKDMVPNEIGKDNEFSGVDKSWSNYPWFCMRCDTKFDAMEDVRAHGSYIHKWCHGFCCADCPEVYNRFSIFVEHVRRHREHLRLFCQFCNTVFKNSTDCFEHTLSHWETRKICELCGQMFPDDCSLLKHQNKNKKKSLTKQSRPRVEIVLSKSLLSWKDYEWTCLDCFRVLPDIESLRKHVQDVHNKCFAMKCADCLLVMSDYAVFVKHVHQHRPYLRHYCAYCNQYFLDPCEMEPHVNDHVTKENYCYGCGDNFANQELLKKHIVDYMVPTPQGGGKSVSCDICLKKFRLLSNLKSHKLIHAKTDEFNSKLVCHICGKVFQTIYLCESHLEMHEDKKEACKIITKKFSKRRLKMHTKSHFDDRLFICDYCGKEFKCKNTMTCHIKIHK